VSRIEGNVPCLRAKSAHFVGYLPPPKGNGQQERTPLIGIQRPLWGLGRSQGLQCRRLLPSCLPLGQSLVRYAEHPDLACGPGLTGCPGNRVGPILSLIEKGSEVALGGIAPPAYPARQSHSQLEPLVRYPDLIPETHVFPGAGEPETADLCYMAHA